MAIRSPTIPLRSVDFPTFGLPMMPMNPDLIMFFSLAAMR
jgi:hypothetical protein